VRILVTRREIRAVKDRANRLVYERFITFSKSNVDDKETIERELKKRSYAVLCSTKRKAGFFWYIDADPFISIERNDISQHIKGTKSRRELREVYFFVRIDEKGNHSFYRIPTSRLQEIVLKRYSFKLDKTRRTKLKNPTKTYFALYPEYLDQYLIHG
jgi:hypothetical protein